MWDVISKTQVYLVTQASLPDGLGWIPPKSLAKATGRVYVHSTRYMQVTLRQPRKYSVLFPSITLLSLRAIYSGDRKWQHESSIAIKLVDHTCLLYALYVVIYQVLYCR